MNLTWAIVMLVVTAVTNVLLSTKPRRPLAVVVWAVLLVGCMVLSFMYAPFAIIWAVRTLVASTHAYDVTVWVAVALLTSALSMVIRGAVMQGIKRAGSD